MLSLSELGIGVAMTYCLYEPIAYNDIEKIKAIIKLYKYAYRMIASIVFILGILILPFVPRIVNLQANIGNIFAVKGENIIKIFNIYNFLGFWINGFVMVAFITLVQPFIIIWIGKKMVVSNFTVVVYFVSI